MVVREATYLSLTLAISLKTTSLAFKYLPKENFDFSKYICIYENMLGGFGKWVLIRHSSASLMVEQLSDQERQVTAQLLASLVRKQDQEHIQYFRTLSLNEQEMIILTVRKINNFIFCVKNNFSHTYGHLVFCTKCTMKLFRSLKCLCEGRMCNTLS